MNDHAKRLTILRKAIQAGRAYLDTYLGRRKVIGYRDETGWAVTNNTGSEWDRRSFLVTVDDIKIGSAAVLNTIH